MYLAAIVLLLLVLPAASVIVEAYVVPGADSLALIGKWFTFWGVGVRLFLAGASQVFRPQFTTEGILGVKGESAYVLAREIGFGNLAIGTLGLLSLAFESWLVPASLAGGLFYGLAAADHVARKGKTTKEWVALVSDFFLCIVLAVFLTSRFVTAGQ